MRIIIVASSDKKVFHTKYRLNPSDYFIGVDGGSIELINRNIKPDLCIGDFDSVDNLSFIKENSHQVKVFSKDKDETDLELALKELDNLKGAKDLKIDIYDATGGRLDHEYNNLLLIAKYSDYKLRLIDESNEIIYLKKGDTYVLDRINCKYFSVLPRIDSVISIFNAEYELNKQHILSTDTYSISNKPLKNGSMPVIEVAEGGLYLFINF